MVTRHRGAGEQPGDIPNFPGPPPKGPWCPPGTAPEPKGWLCPGSVLALLKNKSASLCRGLVCGSGCSGWDNNSPGCLLARGAPCTPRRGLLLPSAAAVTGEGGARLLASSQCHQCLHPVTQAQGASRGMGGKQICSLLRAGGGRVPHVVMESGCPGAAGPCAAQVGGDQQGRPPQGLCAGLPGCPQPISGGSGCPLLAQRAADLPLGQAVATARRRKVRFPAGGCRS